MNISTETPHHSAAYWNKKASSSIRKPPRCEHCRHGDTAHKCRTLWHCYGCSRDFSSGQLFQRGDANYWDDPRETRSGCQPKPNPKPSPIPNAPDEKQPGRLNPHSRVHTLDESATFRALIIRLLEQRPDGLGSAELLALARAENPAVSVKWLKNTVANLVKAGRVTSLRTMAGVRGGVYCTYVMRRSGKE